MSMDDFTSISLLSLAMLVGCYVSGTIPLAVNFSEEKLKLVTVLGAGLLCGTALAVIIPEGVHALYEEVLEGVHHAPGQVEGVGVSEPREGVDAALGVSGEHSHSHEHLHAYIGVSLVLGFVFMLLVDQIGSAHVHSSVDDPESARVASSKITTTLGLVVHAAGKLASLHNVSNQDVLGTRENGSLWRLVGGFLHLIYCTYCIRIVYYFGCIFCLL
uniref:Zinc transporter ZIP9 n=1 Tax=Hucho hucho TaxID=62062 RepID=A0A4W5KNC1_9TELE